MGFWSKHVLGMFSHALSHGLECFTENLPYLGLRDSAGLYVCMFVPATYPS